MVFLYGMFGRQKDSFEISLELCMIKGKYWFQGLCQNCRIRHVHRQEHENFRQQEHFYRSEEAPYLSRSIRNSPGHRRGQTGGDQRHFSRILFTAADWKIVVLRSSRFGRTGNDITIDYCLWQSVPGGTFKSMIISYNINTYSNNFYRPISFHFLEIFFTIPA